jgi:eukaryotic-like serine/threonine-protein kinase
MAEVYKADQELTAGIFRPVALKVIRPEYSESADFREMFLDEARTACTLSHPNIVHIYEVGESDGLLFMAMELVPGETLATVNRHLRDQKERLSDEALFAIGIYCCSALEAVHALKIEGGHVNLVHRDVSPHNLLLSSTGSLKLIDFGIAKAATNRNLTNPGVTKGKAGYFSPEQAMGKMLDGRSDLFSLGVTLYKLACGSTPFDAHKTHAERNGALVRGQWEPLEKVFPGLAPGFYEVLGRSMKLKPDDRWPTARAMREALEKAAYDAGFRVGHSSLYGYVDNAGEISAVPSARHPVLAPPTSVETKAAPDGSVTKAPAIPGPRRHTERMVPGAVLPQKKKLAVWVMPAAFLAAVAVGTVGALFALGGFEGPPKADPVEISPTVPTVVVRPKPKPEPENEDLQKLEPTVEPTPVKVAVVEPVVVVKPPPDRPKPKPVVVVPKEHPKPPAVEDDTTQVPAGEGRLRIATMPASVVSKIMVGRDDWGAAPVDRKVSSGHYVVSVKLENGKKSVAWKGPVMPDRTTMLVYDINTERWQLK